MKTIDEQINDVLESAGMTPLDEVYPQGFDLKVFSQIDTFKERINYCNEYLQKLGAGSSRIAYKVDNEKVLKIAKNQKGIAQNNAEIYGGLDLYPEIFAQIYEADYDNDMWLEMELASRATEQDFKDFFGLSSKEVFGVIGEIYAYTMNEENTHKTENTEKLYQELVVNEGSSWFYTMSLFIMDFSPKYIEDLYRFSNWGVVIRNGSKHLVIIDNGLSNDVAQQFYGAK